MSFGFLLSNYWEYFQRRNVMSGYVGFNSNGRSSNGQQSVPEFTEFEIADAYATAIYNGDPVTLSSGTLILGTSSLTPVGVLRGIRYIDALGQVQRLNYYPASTTNTGTLDFSGGVTGNVVALVEMAQSNSFTIDTSGAAITQAAIGNTFQLASLGVQSGISGRSAATVNLASAATVGTHLGSVRVLRIAPIPGNQVMGQTGATVEVQFIESLGDAT
jgi:hypothetical protein